MKEKRIRQQEKTLICKGIKKYEDDKYMGALKKLYEKREL